MRTYEVTYLTTTEESASGASVSPLLEQHKAKIVSVFPWEGGRRKLIYPIKKQDQAFYTTVVFEAEPNIIQPLEHDLHLNDAILRSLVVSFVPGIFHRSNERITRETAPVEKPAKPESVTPTEEAKETKAPVTPEETETKPEEKAPRKRATRKTVETDKSLDETLDALLNEDITK